MKNNNDIEILKNENEKTIGIIADSFDNIASLRIPFNILTDNLF